MPSSVVFSHHMRPCRRVPDWRPGPWDVVEVAIRFREFAGTYMEHCHNTTHEDHAMLMRWDIEHPGQVLLMPALPFQPKSFFRCGSSPALLTRTNRSMHSMGQRVVAHGSGSHSLSNTPSNICKDQKCDKRVTQQNISLLNR